jgi:hypothetical protein
MKESGAAAGDYHRMQLLGGLSAAMTTPIAAATLVKQI